LDQEIFGEQRMKILIKNKKVLDGLLHELEGKLEIMKDDMPEANDTVDLEAFVIPDIQELKTPIIFDTRSVPNLMGDYVEAAYENLQDLVSCNCYEHIKPEDLEVG